MVCLNSFSSSMCCSLAQSRLPPFPLHAGVCCGLSKYNPSGAWALSSGWGVCGYVGVFIFFQRHVVPKVIYIGSIKTLWSLLFPVYHHRSCISTKILFEVQYCAPNEMLPGKLSGSLLILVLKQKLKTSCRKKYYLVIDQLNLEEGWEKQLPEGAQRSDAFWKERGNDPIVLFFVFFF